ncbi:efflux RND transporter periplasmic adaptor subunit [Herbaspirillum sp. alder98]|uniref:efflux RND transporter periplasmic adaptor subunit n=1 Tax=Herbaspirillum sp. alder98 TaxID=2913096 RepID=UPI001CD82BDE|nr:efflux RND transporter periplasmic adaptor subunit [Herbaspirillum sp. alder98]MCA1325159.1 efflux RND transporter periplasmic adaptor subunit [Herbaspirillum sp. alder98]
MPGLPLGCRRRLSASLLALAPCTLGLAQPAAPASPVAAPATPRSAIEKQDIRAQLAPRRYTTLAAEVGAKINRIEVAEGARFHAGQALILFDCSLQQAQLQKVKAALAGADQTYNANRRLAELNSISKLELEVSQAEANKARADVSYMNISLDKCRLIAPFNGRVAEQRAREQQYVQPGQALLDILDDSLLELDFIVPSKWLIWLKPNQKLQVAIDETGKQYPARILRIGARVDPVSQSIKLTAAIDGQFDELMAGMSGKVLIAPP